MTSTNAAHFNIFSVQLKIIFPNDSYSYDNTLLSATDLKYKFECLYRNLQFFVRKSKPTRTLARQDLRTIDDRKGRGIKRRRGSTPPPRHNHTASPSDPPVDYDCIPFAAGETMHAPQPQSFFNTSAPIAHEDERQFEQPSIHKTLSSKRLQR